MDLEIALHLASLFRNPKTLGRSFHSADQIRHKLSSHCMSLVHSDVFRFFAMYLCCAAALTNVTVASTCYCKPPQASRPRSSLVQRHAAITHLVRKPRVFLVRLQAGFDDTHSSWSVTGKISLGAKCSEGIPNWLQTYNTPRTRVLPSDAWNR